MCRIIHNIFMKLCRCILERRGNTDLDVECCVNDVRADRNIVVWAEATLSALRLFVWSSFYFLACLPSQAHKQQSGQTAVSTCTLGRGGTLVTLTITSSNIYYCIVELDTSSEDHHWMFNVRKYLWKLNCSFWSLVTHKNECKTSKAGVKHLICVPFVESGAYVCHRHH